MKTINTVTHWNGTLDPLSKTGGCKVHKTILRIPFSSTFQHKHQANSHKSSDGFASFFRKFFICCKEYLFSPIDSMRCDARWLHSTNRTNKPTKPIEILAMRRNVIATIA